ncbi:MAG: DUF4141 domain-containing protein [Alistipes sp.]|nr:DUF4141 domain-containing protein [Alistipes sp.]
MKSKMVMLLAALVFVSGAARGQWVVSDPSNLGQSIVNSTKQVVEASKNGSTLLQSFQETQKIYRQGKEYYDKLRAVNNLVRDARKVQQCILFVGEISDMYVTNYQRLLADDHFTARELAVIATGYAKLLQESTNTLKDLQGIVNPSDLSMTDKDRLDVVDKAYTELLRLRNLTDYYTRQNISVALLRAQRDQELERAMALYGTDEEKYW